MVEDVNRWIDEPEAGPIRSGIGTVLKGIGWAIGFIGFGVGFALTYWRP